MSEKFSKSVKNFIDKTNKRLNYIFKDTCEVMSKKIAEKTPVKTGRCLGSWTPSINNIHAIYHPGYSFKNEQDRWINKAKALRAVTFRIEGVCNNLQIGNVYYFTNPRDYSVKLEYGYSKQAPSGMVRITLLEWDRILKESIDKAKARYN